MDAGGRGIELNNENAELKRRVASLEMQLGELQADHRRLLEVESILDRLAELTRAIFWETDAEGLFTRINDLSELVIGYKPDEIIGKMHFFDLFPEEGREEFRRTSMEAFARKDSFRNVGNPVVTRDGRIRWLVTNGVPLLNPDGSLRGYRGLDVDITERKASEEALLVKNYVFDVSIAANSISDTNGLVTEVNDAFLRTWGYPDRSAVIGKAFTDFLAHPDVADGFRERLLREEQWEGDYEARRMDGSTFIAHGLATTLRDKSGMHIGYQSSVIDISETKQVEGQLRESEARNTAILNALPDLMFLLDSEGFFVDFHTASDAQLLMPPEFFLGKRIQDVLPDEIWRPTVARIQSLRNGQETTPFKYEAKMGDDTRYFESRLVSCGDDRFMSIVRDITDLRLGELEQEKLHAQLRQAHKMESVGRLAGGVAHDFNNMLSVILGHVEMAMEKTPPSHPVMADLLEILQSTERSAELTRQLLAFARRQSVSPRVLDLNSTLNGMLNMLRRLIGEDIELRWFPGGDLWPVLVDPPQMSQMLANLCINARQALSGTGRITIKTGNVTLEDDFCREHPGSRKGDHVLLVINDNGCGMDREIIDHIFEPFFTTRQPGQGTGLGLSMVYGIVKQSNGYIDVESEPGKGTEFRVYLPRSRTPVQPLLESVDTSVRQRGNETILLVEDEKSILEMAGIMLENLGYTVLYASTPSMALELARENQGSIRLLITDVIMPELNGRDLAWNLRRIIPGLKCLFMSGYTSNVIAHHGVLDEGVHFIPKPFTSKKLAASVRNALGG